MFLYIHHFQSCHTLKFLWRLAGQSWFAKKQLKNYGNDKLLLVVQWFNWSIQAYPTCCPSCLLLPTVKQIIFCLTTVVTIQQVRHGHFWTSPSWMCGPFCMDFYRAANKAARFWLAFVLFILTLHFNSSTTMTIRTDLTKWASTALMC